MLQLKQLQLTHKMRQAAVELDRVSPVKWEEINAGRIKMNVSAVGFTIQ